MTDHNEPLGVCDWDTEPHKKDTHSLYASKLCRGWRPVEASAPAAPPASTGCKFCDEGDTPIHVRKHTYSCLRNTPPDAELRELRARLKEAKRWFKEFVDPWRADDEETTLLAESWLAKLDKQIAAREKELEGK